MVSNHVMDLIERYGYDSSIPEALTEYVRVRKFYDYDEHSRVGAKHGEFVTDEICDRFCVLGTAEQATAKLKELESIGVDQFNIYLMTHGQEQVLKSYGERDHPAVRRQRRLDGGRAGLALGPARRNERDRRRSGTPSRPGWARRRGYVWDISRDVAEQARRRHSIRSPGETILELAAGPGDTGFSAAPQARPGAAGSISTDVSPAMVAAAEERGRELGLTNVDYRVVDAQAIDLPDESVDGVLCRWGYMLVPDPAAGARRDVPRASARRPGRRSPSGRRRTANPWGTAVGRALLERGLIERPDRRTPRAVPPRRCRARAGARARRRASRRRRSTTCP